MAQIRSRSPRITRPPRTTDTKDLSASLRSNGRCWIDGRVLNLSEGGMLVSSSMGSEVAETAHFELSGSDFRYGGVAEVAHRTGGAIGLRFLSWEGPAGSCVRALVDARLRGAQPGSHHNGLGRRPAQWNSREHERAAVGGLFAVIEPSPGGTASRHQVLDISERGMRILGLELPVGARVSFVLAGHGISHVGHGHVSHQVQNRSKTDAIAGVAVDHWDGAPEAIRALIERGA